MKKVLFCFSAFFIGVLPACGSKDEGGFGGAGTPAAMNPNDSIAGGAGGSADTESDTGSSDTGEVTGGESGGESGGDDSGGEEGGGLSALSVTNFTVSECEGGEDDPSMELIHDDVADHLRVKHHAHWADCCADFTLTATASPAGEVTIIYDYGEAECDCVCAYELSYNVVGLPSGDWTIRIPDGLQETVTLP